MTFERAILVLVSLSAVGGLTAFGGSIADAVNGGADGGVAARHATGDGLTVPGTSAGVVPAGTVSTAAALGSAFRSAAASAAADALAEAKRVAATSSAQLDSAKLSAFKAADAAAWKVHARAPRVVAYTEFGEALAAAGYPEWSRSAFAVATLAAEGFFYPWLPRWGRADEFEAVARAQLAAGHYADALRNARRTRWVWKPQRTKLVQEIVVAEAKAGLLDQAHDHVRYIYGRDMNQHTAIALKAIGEAQMDAGDLHGAGMALASARRSAWIGGGHQPTSPLMREIELVQAKLAERVAAQQGDGVN